MNQQFFDKLAGSVRKQITAHEDFFGRPSYEEIKKILDELLSKIEISKPDIPRLDEIDWQRLLKHITDAYDVQIGEPLVVVTNKDVKRWFDAQKHEIEWKHWDAYKTMLMTQGRSMAVIDETEKVIDTALDFSGDPRITGKWSRKGLIMGNVQSGKTQNYLGLINKSIDAGYRTIIVLGGHLNDLRMQTQERIDEGVLGRYSRHLIEVSASTERSIGVALL
jgi:hypothetical protein